MKNSNVAFMLNVFPGLGFIYLGKTLRGLFYMFSIIAPVILSILLTLASTDVAFLAVSFIGFFLYIISFIDMLIQNSKRKIAIEVNEPGDKPQESERFYTILLSLIPGLGHFQLGLMNRGLTLLATFLGMGIMIIFVTALTGREEFLVFLAAIPIIWVYGFFDAVQQFNKKQRGESLEDQTIFEDFETRREDGKKSKAIATFLSIFPGAGHLYLGLQRRGVQLMAAFLFSIYILDFLRLGIFLFFIPIIWFYSFFDGLQKASRYGNEEMEDVPLISYFINHQKWVGIGLLLLGLYYLLANIFIPALSPILINIINVDLVYWFDRYFQTAVVCVLLIGGGLKLLLGSKRKETQN
jgi:hypothetical protein